MTWPTQPFKANASSTLSLYSFGTAAKSPPAVFGHTAIHPPHRRLAYLYGLPASTPMTRQPTKGREQLVTGVTNARLYSFNVIGCVDAS